MKITFQTALGVLLLVTSVHTITASNDIPIIDAHSQLPSPDIAHRVIDLMDRAGVSHTILSFRGSARGKHLINLASNHPTRITPAIKAKGRHWPAGNEKYFKKLNKQVASGKFGALGEALFYHAAKGNIAPEWTVLPGDEQALLLLDIARENGWPLITHIEFAALGDEKESWMERLEAMLSKNRDLNFPMMHMGQLEAPDVERLLNAHPNIYFMTSHSNTIVVNRSNQPWINMFSNQRLKPEWVDLMVRYPERFILSFDNVFERHWGQYYLDQVTLWRKALKQLPKSVAHAVAHKNAERLWGIKPLHSGE